eukprot:g8193.t1
MLLFDRFVSQSVFENESNFVTCLSPNATQLAIVNDRDQLRIVNCSGANSDSFGQTLLFCELNWSSVGGHSVFLSWSSSGTKLAVGLSDGRIQIFSALGVSLNLFEFPNQLKFTTGLSFITGETVLVCAGEGKVYILNIVDSKLNLLINLSRFHYQPKLATVVENEVLIVAGFHPYSEKMNISMWKLSADLQSCVLLKCLLEPVSRSWSWLFSHASMKQESFSLCLSPKGDTVIILSQKASPMVYNISETSLTPIELESSAVEVMDTVDTGCFWSDSVFAVSTRIGKIVLLEVKQKIALLSSEDAAGEVCFVGHVPSGGVFYIESQSSSNEKKLICLKQETPSEHISTLVGRQDFSAALELAETAGLSKEAVYKSMWTQNSYSSISCSELTNYFENISDLDWILNVCLTITGENLQDQEQILKHGLHELKEVLNSAHRMEQYLSLLKQLEMFCTFKALHPGSYSWKAFQAFRMESPVSIAKAFVQNSNIHAMQVLFRFLGWSLFPHLMEILNSIPATMNPKDCSRIYPSIGLTPDLMNFSPCLDPSLLDPIRPLEQFIQNQEVLSKVPNQVLMELHKSGSIKTIELFTEQELQDFYLQESDRIEAETGDLEHARQVLEWGIKKGVKTTQLQSRIHKIHIFQLWMKSGALPWDLKISTFSELTTKDRIQSYLDSITDSEIMEVLKEVLIPLGAELPPSSERTEFQKTLLHYLLKRDVLVFEELISLECTNGDLFGASVQGSIDLLSSVITAIESAEKIWNWKILTETLDLIVKQVTLLTRDTTESKNPVLIVGQNLLEICQLGEVLGKYGISVEYQQIKYLDHSTSMKFIKSILSHAVRNGRHWTDTRWDECLSDVTSITQRTPSIKQEMLHDEFFQTLLRSGQFHKAQEFKEQNLDARIAEEISWKIGHELMCSLADLSDSKAVKEAIDCLNMFPESSRSKNEIRKLKSLEFLNTEFGVSLLPVELEQLESKTEVIKMILEASQHHYCHREALSRLSKELKFTDNEILESWKLLCRTALLQEDLLEAESLVKELQSRKIKQSWILALEVLEANKPVQILTQDQEQDLWILVISNSDQDLQDHLHQMHPAFPELDFSYSEFTRTGKYPSCEDALFYALDSDWRGQIRSQQDYNTVQKWRVYEFVCSVLNSVENQTPEDASLVRLLLESTPRSMKSQLEHSGAGYQGLELDWNALVEQDHLEGNFQQIQTLLPALDGLRFHKDSHYRHQVILELAKYAAELLYLQERPIQETRRGGGVNWEEVWSSAIEQGSKFGIETWELYSHFAVSLASLVDCPFSSVELVMESLEDTLKTRNSKFIQSLLNEAWDQANSVHGVAFILKIVQRMAQESKQQFLSTSACFILEWNVELDLRIPVYLPLRKFVLKEFGFEFCWNPPLKELEFIYRNVKVESLENFLKLYSIFELVDADLEVTSSQVSSLCAVKELLRDPWTDQILESSFWKTILLPLSDADLINLATFVVFKNPSNLQTRMESLSPEFIKSLDRWSPEKTDHSKLSKVFLESVMELLEGTSRLETQLVDWRKELKRVKIQIASQGLEGMDSIITSEDFSENLKSLIKKLILDGKNFLEVFESIQNFCQSSDEHITDNEVMKYFKQSAMSFQQDSEVLLLVSCLDCLTSEKQEMVESVQQEIWNSFLSQLGTIQDPGGIKVEKLEAFLLIAQKILQTSAKTVDDELDNEWFSAYYFKSFMQSFEAEDFQSIMRVLCQKQEQKPHPVLNPSQGEKLFDKMEGYDPKLAASVGLLLPYNNLHERAGDILLSLGDAQTLAVLLQSEAEIQLSYLLESIEWLADILKYCPPHPTVFEQWIEEQDTKVPTEAKEEQQQKQQQDQESNDGWDFDSEEEENDEEEAGWSDVDELDTALEAMNQPIEDSQERIEDLKLQDSQFIGSCCFVLLLVKLLEENRKDLAAELVSEKFGLHKEMFRLTGGVQLLKTFLSKQANDDNPTLEDYKYSICHLWSHEIIIRLFQKWRSSCRTALELMEESPR